MNNEIKTLVKRLATLLTESDIHTLNIVCDGQRGGYTATAEKWTLSEGDSKTTFNTNTGSEKE